MKLKEHRLIENGQPKKRKQTGLNWEKSEKYFNDFVEYYAGDILKYNYYQNKSNYDIYNQSHQNCNLISNIIK